MNVLCNCSMEIKQEINKNSLTKKTLIYCYLVSRHFTEVHGTEVGGEVRNHHLSILEAFRMLESDNVVEWLHDERQVVDGDGDAVFFEDI